MIRANEDLSRLFVVCPICFWKGWANEAVALPDEMVLCPQCRWPVHKVAELEADEPREVNADGGGRKT